MLTATKIVRNPMKNEQGVDIYTDTILPNAVYTLLTAIVQAFIGSNPVAIERNKDLLINLKCPTLTHFRWYKDVFLTKIMMRPDANADFWKEKFIAGLPNLFAQKVKDFKSLRPIFRIRLINETLLCFLN